MIHEGMIPFALLLVTTIAIGMLMAIAQINFKVFSIITIAGSAIQIAGFNDYSNLNLCSSALMSLFTYNGWISGYLWEIDKLGPKIFPSFFLPPHRPTETA